MKKRKDASLIHFPTCTRGANLQRQTKEGMDGVATSQDSGNTSRGKRYELLVNHFLHVTQKCCLTSSCTSCEEETAICAGNQVIGEHLLPVLFVKCVFHCYRCSSLGSIWVSRVLKSGSRKLL